MAKVNNEFKYRGYRGSAQVSVEDNCLFGRVLGTRHVITYEAQSIDQLRKEFERSVDYLLNDDVNEFDD